MLGRITLPSQRLGLKEVVYRHPVDRIGIKLFEAPGIKGDEEETWMGKTEKPDSALKEMSELGALLAG